MKIRIIPNGKLYRAEFQLNKTECKDTEWPENIGDTCLVTTSSQFTHGAAIEAGLSEMRRRMTEPPSEFTVKFEGC